MTEPVPKKKAKRVYKNTPATRAAKIKYQALHRDPVKASAHDKVRHAINRGDLVPPKECQECAAIPVTADGAVEYRPTTITAIPTRSMSNGFAFHATACAIETKIGLQLSKRARWMGRRHADNS